MSVHSYLPHITLKPVASTATPRKGDATAEMMYTKLFTALALVALYCHLSSKNTLQKTQQTTQSEACSETLLLLPR